jgi:hypothetical protein
LGQSEVPLPMIAPNQGVHLPAASRLQVTPGVGQKRGGEEMSTCRCWRIPVVVIVLCLWACVFPSFADTGDTCSEPIQVPFAIQWEYSGDLAPYANDYDPGVPGPSCTGSAAPGKDAVFAVEVSCAEWLDVSLQPVGFDGAIYIVTDCADVTGSCVSGSDAVGVGVTEGIGLAATATRTYYVIVDAHNADSGGTFHISFLRGPWDFPPGACCRANGHCEILDVVVCEENGGQSHGPCSQCEPNPCFPVPALEATWGAVKARYR